MTLNFYVCFFFSVCECVHAESAHVILAQLANDAILYTTTSCEKGLLFTIIGIGSVRFQGDGMNTGYLLLQYLIHQLVLLKCLFAIELC